MSDTSYLTRRGEIETYFDKTAVEAWARLTSDAPVGSIRATVRAGRDRMRATLLRWLPADLSGKRLLDAGCGTGALAVEAARRGADVVAIDLSPKLVQLAAERAPSDLGSGSIRFCSGDMTDAALGDFDHVAAMDSVIHNAAPDAVASLARLAARTSGSIVFTFAPKTPLLAAMHAAGKWFPRADRAPAIVPVGLGSMMSAVREAPGMAGWRAARCERINSGFYMSQAMELVRA